MKMDIAELKPSSQGSRNGEVCSFFVEIVGKKRDVRNK